VLPSPWRIWVVDSAGSVCRCSAAVVQRARLRLLISVVAACYCCWTQRRQSIRESAQIRLLEGCLHGLHRPPTVFRSCDQRVRPPLAAPTALPWCISMASTRWSATPPRVLRLLRKIERGLDPGTVLFEGGWSRNRAPVKAWQKAIVAMPWLWRRLFALQEEHPLAWIRPLECSSFSPPSWCSATT